MRHFSHSYVYIYIYTYLAYETFLSLICSIGVEPVFNEGDVSYV